MEHDVPAYGHWFLVVGNAAIFIFFAFSFARPESPRDWRSFGAFSAFIVALFVEMYGFPLTIYLLAGWLQTRYPGLDPLTHDAGHIWTTLFGWRGNPHFSPPHVASNLLIAAGFLIVAYAWPVLHAAQMAGHIAVSGPYRWIRHPQYVGFIAILTGFLLQWPTILTVAMYPFLVGMYVVLARREENGSRRQFGAAYDAYVEHTPAWIPSMSQLLGRQAAN